jgi:hypothetical protein
MEYIVNNTKLSYHPLGHAVRGEEKTLLAKAVDLTLNRSWHHRGFTIEKLFDDLTFSDFQRKVSDLLIELWRKAGLTISKDFQLDHYHLEADSPEKHLRAIDQTRLLQASEFPLGAEPIEKRISEICDTDLIAKNYPYDNQSVFHFRIVRPQTTDNNPLHRDVWLEDYRDCINIYIPIAGSDEQSSLILLPGSHLWPESKLTKTVSGATINDVKFNVPAVTEIHGEFSAVRPDPKQNEVLVFSPYLIHGGAVNLNTNTTRISIEMRFWKK